MKKLVFSSIILLAALAGCTKINQLENQPKEGKTISLFANLPEGTKVSYASNGAANEGFTTSYDGSEHLFLWFEDRTLHYHELTVSSSTASSATFTGTLTDGYYPTDPGDFPVNFGAFVTSRKIYGRGSSPWASYWFSWDNKNSNVFNNRISLSQQDGTAEMATAASVLFASGTLDNESDSPTLSFNYLTSILKFVVTLPDGVVADENNTEIFIHGTNLYDIVHVNEITGEFVNANSYATGITVVPDASIFSGQTITGYVTLWTSADGIKIKDATIDVIVNGTDTYSVTLANSTGSTLAPGKVYTFRPASKLALHDITKWTNDDSSTIPVAAGLTVDSTPPSWMHYNDGTGVVTIDENTTGHPRQGKLVFESGAVIDITQISRDDFVGDWTMYIYRLFAGSIGAGNAYASAAQNAIPTVEDYSILETNLAEYYTKSATLAKLDGESKITSSTNSGIYQYSTEHTHNMTIEGFSDPGLLVKAQLEIDLDGQNATLGLQVMQPFVTSEQIATPQHFSTSGFSSYYAWLMPELCQVYANGTVKSWHFNFGTLGGDNKCWLDANISVEGDVTKIYWDLQDGNRPTLTTSTSYKIAGLMVNPFTASGTSIGASGGPTASTLVRNISNVAKTGATSNNAAWQYVYQGSICLTK